MTTVINNQRLLLVMGMARSGTTIFTYVLCQHNRIALFRGGSEHWLLENDCLPQQNIGRLSHVASMWPNATYVTLKRPWQEELGAWLTTHLPKSKFIIMRREKQRTIASWARLGPRIMVGRMEALKNLDLYYDKYVQLQYDLLDMVGDRGRILQFEQMVTQPQYMFDDVAEWLDVPNTFDVTPITREGSWSRKLSNRFVRGDKILGYTEEPESWLVDN